MDFAGYLSTAWDYLMWFSNTVLGTVSESIMGGWMAVFGLAGAAFVLFLITSVFAPRRDD